MTDVTARLSEVRARIRVVCKIAVRSEETVRLVAVSSGHPPSVVREAYAGGQRDFGEFVMDDLVNKAKELQDLPEIRWRFIGQLKHTRTKDAARIGCTVDSISSEREAIALNRRAQAFGRTVDVMIRVNLAAEKQKAGCTVPEVAQIARAIRSMDKLRLIGLLTIPPAVSEPELSRPWFRRLRLLGNQLSLNEFSMGMSDDLEVAIEEGATMIRVGTALFGRRNSGGFAYGVSP
ncbi:MAG: YggS family pyridoxal phosphate-dependent enzyme [Deltaproteobacteria bacterium]|nr:YggS family pyridoxal phosphate-dependent enzyme [Deltaproteobacteria bacterium]